MYPERRVAILSEGCAANFGDGEEIGEKFAQKGFLVSFEFPSATPDAMVLNACTVKGISGALKLARKIRESFREVPVWVTGCATEDLKRELTRLYPDFTFGPRDAHKNEEAFRQFIRKLDISESDQAVRFQEISCHRGIGIVNIEEGCLDSCHYCSTHLVKGVLKSASPETIVRRVQKKVEQGNREIFLTGQDTSCYGFDIRTNLAELLQRVIVKVPGNYRIRVGMGNPRHIFRYLDALVETFTDEHLYKFIHIPVQSGSDRILRAMNRRHTCSDFFRIAETFRMHFPDMNLGTDIIVAYPGETREDFAKSLELVQKVKPSICNITRFVPREGTPAASLPDGIEKEERYARSAKISRLFQSIALSNNQKFIGKKLSVVVEKKGSHPGTSIARDDFYRPVALRGEYDLGECLSVQIKEAETFALIGKPV